MTEGRHSTTFAEVFSEALEARELTLSRVQKQLQDAGNPISLASLSYWRSGARIPDPGKQSATIAQLEKLLGLDTDTLSELSLHRPPRRRSVDPPAARFGAEVQRDDAMRLFREASRVLDAPFDEGFRELSVQQITDVNRDGFPTWTSLRVALQCTEGVLDRLMFASVSANGIADKLELTVIDGGRIVGQYVNPQNTIIAIAVEFERPLQVGDSGVVTVETRYAPAATERSIGVGVHRRTKKVVNWVRFHPDAVPDWLRQVEATNNETRHAFRGLDTPTTTHDVRWDFGPGSVVLDWGYGKPPMREPA